MLFLTWEGYRGQPPHRTPTHAGHELTPGELPSKLTLGNDPPHESRVGRCSGTGMGEP